MSLTFVILVRVGSFDVWEASKAFGVKEIISCVIVSGFREQVGMRPIPLDYMSLIKKACILRRER